MTAFARLGNGGRGAGCTCAAADGGAVGADCGALEVCGCALLASCSALLVSCSALLVSCSALLVSCFALLASCFAVATCCCALAMSGTARSARRTIDARVTRHLLANEWSHKGGDVALVERGTWN